MSLAIVLLSLLLACFISLTFSYRRSWLGAESRGSACSAKRTNSKRIWNLRAMYRREVAMRFSLPTTLDQLSDAKVSALYHGLQHGFPDERTEEMPSWVPIGTMGNPLRLVRVTDSSLNDTARYSELRDFFSRTVEP